MTKCCMNCKHFCIVVRDHEIWDECDLHDLDDMILDVFDDYCDDFEEGDTPLPNVRDAE